MGTSQLAPWVLVALSSCVAIGLAGQNLRLRSRLDEVERGVAQQRLPAFIRGERLPDVRTVDLRGEASSLTRVVHGVTVVFIFTTTCPYCSASIESVRQLARVLRQADSRLVGLALDGLPAAREYATAEEPDWPIVVPAGLEEARELGVSRVPLLVLLQEAEVLETWLGEVTAATVDAVAAAALEAVGNPEEGS